MENNITKEISKEKKLLDIDDLKRRYGLISDRTLKNWKKTKGLPLFEISPQHKYVWFEDLIKWEKLFRNEQIPNIQFYENKVKFRGER
jgi:hypothetical protein